MVNLTEYRTALRLDLKDSGALWSDDELDRSVTRAVGDLSRFAPLESVYEHTIDYTVTGESSVAPAVATWKALTYKPIKPESETITTDPAGTTYTRDTDYTMDYVNGKYTIISGGSITEADNLLVSYTKSRLGIDISAIITSLIRVTHVEYPVDRIPQQLVSYNIWNDLLYIGSQKVGSSQTQLTDKEHIAIYYEKEHTAPTVSADGSYQDYLDQVICIGAGAYALLMKALQYEHQSVTDLVSVRTELGFTTTLHTNIGTALTALAAIHTLTDVALDKVTTYVTDADTALDAAITQMALGPTALAKIDTYLAGATESTKALLAQITTDVAGLRTAFLTAVDAAKAYLDEVDTTDLVGAEGVWAEEVKHILTEAGIPNAEDFLELGDDSINISTILTDVETALDKIATEIAAGKTYLETGDDTINTVNVGDNVPELYRDYGNVEVGLGAGYRQEASERLAKATLHQRQAELYLRYAGAALELARLWDAKRKDFLTEAMARTNAALGFIGEASARLEAIGQYLNQSSGYTTIAIGFTNEAAGRVSVARAYIEEAGSRLGMCNAFITEANGRVAEMDRYLNEAGVRLSQINAYLSEAGIYANLAGSDRELADRFKAEGIERRNEFWSILRDKSEYRKRVSSTPVRQ
jgi:hypothetical protein